MTTSAVDLQFYAGVTDLPIEEIAQDNLRIMAYIEGLSDFIRSCATPMTIALQSDWGTGKTSFMNLVNNQLLSTDDALNNSQIATIVFNTWKYVQFNQEQNLSLSFLSHIISKLYGKTISEIVEPTAGYAIDGTENKLATAVKMLDQLAASTNSVKDEATAQRSSYVESAIAIEELKQQLTDAVNYKLKTDNCERLVIFIDDLDRLNPVVAVNLLEVMKIFLDIPNCVFVLAVDYNIVMKGIKLKNHDMEMDDEKAHNFFDKMIQVPFRIPKEFYSFEQFLHINLPGITQFGELNLLIRQSIGNNPRGVKRLINAYHLISKIMFRTDGEYNEKQKGQLLALLCMQLSHEPLYRYFYLENNALNMFGAETEERLEQLLDEANIGYSKSNVKKHLLFLSVLRSYLFGQKAAHEIDVDNEEDQEVVELFSMILSYANVTNESTVTDVEEMIQVPLSDIQNYAPADYGVVSLHCNSFNLKSKTANGLAFEMFERVIASNEQYIETLRDYKNLPAMQKAGIKKRLILPYLKHLSDRPKVRQWMEQNIPEFVFQQGEYPATLTERPLPGVGYSITTNYASLATIQNLHLILSYLGDEHIAHTTVMLKKKKKKKEALLSE